jgi:hypothetical protein
MYLDRQVKYRKHFYHKLDGRFHVELVYASFLEKKNSNTARSNN